jgi:glycosyltransferase involved in cell wall biosynthesis
MRIVQITPGSGDSFFCENCLRDDAAVRELIKLGHDVQMVPLYLPVLDKTPGVDSAPIFFGGINVFLQQKLGVFRHTPRWLDKLFDRPGLLRLAARFSGMTSAADLGRTTLSMLKGPGGRQAKELSRLVSWLCAQDRPHLVVLSNVLLAGLAAEIKSRLGCKIACLLQDEDEFLDSLTEPHRSQSWARLAELADGIDMFIAASDSYSRLMQDRLALPPQRICVVRNGVDPDAFPPRSPQSPPPDPPAVGFLSRAYFTKGLDTLVEAFAILKVDGRNRRLRLRLAGGMLGEDQPYVNRVRKLIAQRGLADCVDCLPNLDLARRRDFYGTLRLLCVPERRNQAGGLYVLESMASGVPVVQPDCGVFPELIAATGGGLLVRDQSPAGYAQAIGQLLSDPAKATEMGRQARLAVQNRFTTGRMAHELSEIYRRMA